MAREPLERAQDSTGVHLEALVEAADMIDDSRRRSPRRAPKTKKEEAHQHQRRQHANARDDGQQPAGECGPRPRL